MRLASALVAALFVLNGCILGTLEKETKETKAEVKATNDKLEDTKNAQHLGLALELMSNKDKSPNLRVAAAENVFVKAPDDRIFEYIGAMGPLHLALLPKKIGTKTLEIPNVTVVGEKADPTLGAAPVNEDLYGVLATASLRLVNRLTAKASKPGISGAELAQLREVGTKMVYIATAIHGASQLTEITKPAVVVGLATREFSSQKRLDMHAALLEMAKALSLPENVVNDIKQFSNVRMGVRS